MAQTARTRYVFLDVVGFTLNRSVEAQADVVTALNGLVTRALSAVGILASDKVVLIPTGDGIAIAMISDSFDLDAHVILALEILKNVDEHNSESSDESRRFQIRVGINENVDNLVTDINGRQNVAGAGISMAQRIMDQAGGGQVLVGRAVYETLHQREKYRSNFRRYSATTKHGFEIEVYQLINETAPGLSLAPPPAFGLGAPQLTQFAAHYMALAGVNRTYLFSQRSHSAHVARDMGAIVLLNFLAEDAIREAQATASLTPTRKVWANKTRSFPVQHRHYRTLDFWVIVDFAELIIKQKLQPYGRWYFEPTAYLGNYALVNDSGINAVKSEWPQVAVELGLD